MDLRSEHFQLETDRLILRDYRCDDWERVHIYSSVPQFSQYENWGPNTEDQTRDFVARMIVQARESERFKYDLAVCLKEPDLLIGGCGIRRESQSSAVANLGWAINPEFQRRGFATEAASALIFFGFDCLDLCVIYATCDARNEASYRVMEKLGMTRVGFLKEDRVQKEHLRDTFRYEIRRQR